MLRSKIFVTGGLFLAVIMLFAGTSRAMNYCQYDLDFDSAGLWHLNEGSGTVIHDESASGFDGTFAGTTPPTWSAGLFSGGIQTTCYYDTAAADGSCGVQFDDNQGLVTYISYTLEMYLKWDFTTGPIPGDGGFVGVIAHDQGLMFVRSHIDDSNALAWKATVRYGIQDYNGWQELTTSGTGYSLDPNVWTHVAVSAEWTDRFRPGDGHQIRQTIHIDGELAAEQFIAGYGMWGSDLTIGYLGAGASCTWGGEMDEIRVSRPVRDPNEFGCDECGSWGYLDGDINADCNVAFADFAELASDWATCSGYAGDIVDKGDGCIDLYDLDKFAKDWLKCTRPGDPECLDCYSIVEFTEGTVGPNTVALWHLNEGSGTISYDEVSNIELTINAGSWADVSWGTGKFGDGLNFGLNGEGMSQSTDLNMCGTGDPDVYELTVEQWISVDGSMPNASYGAGISGGSFMRVQPDGTSIGVGFYTYIGGGYWVDAYISPSGPGQPVGTDWHHIAQVYNGIADDNNDIHVYLYLNGVLVVDKPWPADNPLEELVNSAGDGTLHIGNTSWSQNWYGDIDEVCVTTLVKDQFFESPCD